MGEELKNFLGTKTRGGQGKKGSRINVK